MTPTIARLQKLGLIIAGLGLFGVLTWCCWPRLTPEDWFQRGMDSVAREDWPAVLLSAKELKENSEYAPQEHLLRGIYQLKMNRPAAALREFGRLEPTGQLREPALLFAGEAFYREGRLAESRRLLSMLSHEQPGHTSAHRWLAAIAYDLGAMQEAIDELQIVLRLDPTDYRPNILLGHIYSDMERFTPAIDAYFQAVAAHPPAPVLEELLPLLAKDQMQIRKYSDALKTLTDAPKSAGNLALQAECRFSLGETSEAVKLIQQARELEPDQLDVLRLVGRMEIQAGHATAATELLQSVVQRDPQDHESRYQLAQALRLIGKLEESNLESQKAADTIKLKVKLAELTKLAIAQPNEADIRDEMANLCDALGKPELANSWRQAAAACRLLTPPSTPSISHKQVDTGM